MCWIARGTHTGEVTTLANLQVVDGKRSPRRYGKAASNLLLAA